MNHGLIFEGQNETALSETTAYNEADSSHFNQQLQIIVVSHAHFQVSGKTAVAGINYAKGTQPPTCQWLSCEDFQCIAVDGESGGCRQICMRSGVYTGHALCQVASAEP